MKTLKSETKKAPTTYDRLIKDPSFKKQLKEQYSKLLFSEMLIKLMEEEKISVRKLAVKSGVSSSFIQDLRSGRQINPSINAISKLFIAMNAELVVKRPGKKPLELNLAIK